MLREYPNNVTFHDRGFIEQLGGYFLDSVAMGHELRPRRMRRPIVSVESLGPPDRSLFLTRLRLPAMSAIRSLSEVNRTYLG